jgi:hypothetical protein
MDNRDKSFCIHKSVYRYQLEFGTVVFFDKEEGLNIMQFDIRDGEDIIKSIDEILKYEKDNK